MKGIKVLLGLSITAVGLTAVGAGIAITQNEKSAIVQTNAATFNYDANNVFQRRIYFVNNDNGGYWYQGWNLEAQVWYGSTYSGFVGCTEIYGKYYYCVDFTSEVVGFLGGDLHIEFRVLDGTYKYTSTCYNIPAIDKKSFDVVYLNNGSPSLGSTVDVGENTDIIASVLDHYQTCTTNYASGYYGYPQLLVDFITSNQTAINNHGDTTMCEEGTYSINAKIAKLSSLYTANGWVKNS